jgi:hypothetical protein
MTPKGRQPHVLGLPVTPSSTSFYPPPITSAGPQGANKKQAILGGGYFSPPSYHVMYDHSHCTLLPLPQIDALSARSCARPSDQPPLPAPDPQIDAPLLPLFTIATAALPISARSGGTAPPLFFFPSVGVAAWHSSHGDFMRAVSQLVLLERRRG